MAFQIRHTMRHTIFPLANAVTFATFLLILSADPATAATINAASCSQSDVQSAINSAQDGDTVMVPAGECTWTVTVNIPNSKGLIVHGAGSGSTIIGRNVADGDHLIKIFTNPEGSTRITGFTFLDNHSTPQNGYIITVEGSSQNARFRLDHNTFTSTGTNCNTTNATTALPILINISNGQYGLVDNNIFNSGVNSEMIHNSGNWEIDWANDITQGSDQALYVEDNYFTNNCLFAQYDIGRKKVIYYFTGNSAIQNYYGSRIVFRHNTLIMSQIDVHGGSSLPGGRWFEIYDNVFKDVNDGYGGGIALRGGSGVVFNNHANDIGYGTYGIVLQEEDAGIWPLIYQIGRGKNQSSDPVYFWSNDWIPYVQIGADFIQEERDYFNAIKSGFVPYIYPHPLTIESDITAPSIPTNVQVQ